MVSSSLHSTDGALLAWRQELDELLAEKVRQPQASLEEMGGGHGGRVLDAIVRLFESEEEAALEERGGGGGGGAEQELGGGGGGCVQDE